MRRAISAHCINPKPSTQSAPMQISANQAVAAVLAERLVKRLAEIEASEAESASNLAPA